MSIQRRFMKYLLLGFGMWIILLGITVPILLEVVLPKLGLGSTRYEWMVLIIISLVTILCLFLFGWFFGSPLLLMMKWINQLAHEDFSTFDESQQMYTGRGKLKMRYRLYQEVFGQLLNMRLQLEKANIERAQIETAKRDWIAGISHDLFTPLTYIKGYSTLLLNPEYNWSREEQRQFIQEIDDKSTHMEQLVQDLKLATRFDASEKTPIHSSRENIVKVVQQIIADASNDLRAQHHHFELDTEAKDILVTIDANLLKRALQNIYINSILHNKSAVNIVTTIRKEKQHVAINIKDDGIGMTEETKKNIFNRYYRGTKTSQSSEGTGLGMAIVKQLIEAHDGAIRVESSRGKGTAFIIKLPIK